MNWSKSTLLIGLFFLVSACNDDGRSASPRKAELILAISWQPAFCETHSRKKECRSQSSKRFDASHFALHGLWPQPRSASYCDVSRKGMDRDKKGKWQQISRLELRDSLRADLQKVMPGYQSGLHRHEWIKHGSCYSSNAQKYFADSLILMDELNGSGVRKLFVDNIGNHLTTEQIRSAMNESFGEGSGLRLRVKCSNDKNSGRLLISELTLALAGDINESDNMGKLLLAAFPDNKKGCPGGIIDPVGLQ